MSLHHLRRTLGCKHIICSATTALSSSNPISISHHISPEISNNTTTLPIRHFAAAAAKKSKKKDASSGINGDQNGLSYKERKDAAKQKRRETWDRKQQRLERLKTRRDDSPKDVLKKKFRSWYDKELMYHDKLCRLAKKESKPWRIRVAAMVERLPVVTPDIEDWEREYIVLRDYLWTFGKEYPEETGFMYAPDKPEDHIVPTDEELLGECLHDFCIVFCI